VGRLLSFSWAMPTNAVNPTGFTIQRATDAAFTLGLNNQTVALGSNRTATQQGVTATSTAPLPGVKYWFRIRSYNNASPTGSIISGWTPLTGTNVAEDGSLTP
jgi:hypothetical protein